MIFQNYQYIFSLIIGYLLFFILTLPAYSELLFSPEGRLVIREDSGRVTVYTDKDSDGTFDYIDILEYQGIRKVHLPSAGRIILQGDGLSVCVDSDKDGKYDMKHILIPTNVSSMQMTGKGRIVIREKNGRVSIFTDTEGKGVYDTIHNIAVSGVRDVSILGENRILLRYTDGRIVVYTDKDNDSTYEIVDTLVTSGVDWFTLSGSGQIFYRVAGKVTVVADIDSDGIYEQKYNFPESNVSNVWLKDNRVFIRNSVGSLTQYYDKSKNTTFGVHQQLLISGMRNYTVPSAGKVIIEGNDGSIASYWDKDTDGIYETTSIFGAPAAKK